MAQDDETPETAALKRARDAVNKRLAARPLGQGLETELPVIVDLLNRIESRPQALKGDPLEAMTALPDGTEQVNVVALQALRQQISINIWARVEDFDWQIGSPHRPWFTGLLYTDGRDHVSGNRHGDSRASGQTNRPSEPAGAEPA